MENNTTAAILFLIYRRPETTQKVFEAIRKARPAQLFVAADGPKDGQQQACQQTRQIVEHIDWDCELKTLFRDTNLGCKIGVSSAIDWFFEHVEEGIILEDDTLPDADFFRFCSELLARYRHDNRVSSISGSNPFKDQIGISESYFFSKYNRIWGWATWRRAWRHYDVNISFWPELKKNKRHYAFFANPMERRFYEMIWDQCYHNQIDTWDYQWLLCRLAQSMLTAVSAENIVQNIGFGRDSTHTRSASNLSNYPMGSLKLPLVHPSMVCSHYRKDRISSTHRFTRKFLKMLLMKMSITK